MLCDAKLACARLPSPNLSAPSHAPHGPSRPLRPRSESITKDVQPTARGNCLLHDAGFVKTNLDARPGVVSAYKRYLSAPPPPPPPGGLL